MQGENRQNLLGPLCVVCLLCNKNGVWFHFLCHQTVSPIEKDFKFCKLRENTLYQTVAETILSSLFLVVLYVTLTCEFRAFKNVIFRYHIF